MRFESALRPPRFFGTVVVRCAFLLAVFGWGAGFYGPPIYLAEVAARTGWPLTLISAAVTVHFLFGALVAANLPRLHDRLGLGFTTAAGALMTAVGVFGWATVWQPWQLFVAALLSGAGWVAMGAVAVNVIVARWYAAGRPAALARAYNGASLGGVIFSPLWVALIHVWGFPTAAAVVGCVMFLIVAAMSHLAFSRTPVDLGLALDGAEARHRELARQGVARAELPRGALWRDRAFLTLAAGMAMGLFAQIGLLAHLFTLLTPALGAQATGFLVGGGTACAILGRAAAVRLLAHVNDRRLVAAASYLVQASGAAILLAAWDGQAWAIICGVALFGMGIGNATSLPPAIAQDDFAATDVQRAVALIVAIAQGSYAFAPAIFGMLLYAGEPLLPSGGGHVALLFTAAIAIQLAAAATLLAGRRHCVEADQVQAAAVPPDRR
jgi:MFS family permease